MNIKHVETQKTCLERCMTIKPVVAVVAQICVETDSIHDFSCQEREKPSRTSATWQRNFTSLPLTLALARWTSLLSNVIPTDSMTLCNAWKIWSCLVRRCTTIGSLKQVHQTHCRPIAIWSSLALSDQCQCLFDTYKGSTSTRLYSRFL